jgi:hypothetical protein
MPVIACPACDEDEDLTGAAQPDGTVEITCGRCAHAWERGAEPTCRLCGSTDLVRTAKPLWEKGRGDQHTPAGRIATFRCHTCGGRNVTSGDPVPGPPDHTAPRFASADRPEDEDPRW